MNNNPEPRTLHTTCCIAGGGPAGMVMGYLLSRIGVPVIVLEKHADFFRDFRGDTIHPSTLQIMDELGLLDAFLQVPHQEIRELGAMYNGNSVMIADFSHLPIRFPRLLLMPQWDFLNFMATQARQYPSFQLLQNTQVQTLLKDGSGKVTGVQAVNTAGEILHIQALLTIGADGRTSTVREQAGLHVIKTGAPIDVLWFRISRHPDDPPSTLGRFQYGLIMIMLDRGTYWQCAFVIGKGGLDDIKAKGMPAFKETLLRVSPFFSNRMEELKDWDDIKLLSVAIDHLERWYTKGLLCIGDAAHAMSPVGGVGINLAIQDAVAAARILGPALQQGRMDTALLAKVQQRRAFPTRVVQRVQVAIQNNIIVHFQRSTANNFPWVLRLLKRWPYLRRIPARFIGMGIRPEHVK